MTADTERARYAAKMAVIICSTILGLMALIGASFGTLGLKAAFIVLGGVVVLFVFSMGSIVGG
jgi:hypothetical protein